MTPQEELAAYSQERLMIMLDKEINNLIQIKLETGEWIMNSEGFLVSTK